MVAKLLSISAPTIPSSLATAEVELVFDNYTTVRISDLRILRNQQGQLWLGWPMRNIQGKFVQVVSSSRLIQRLIEDAVFPAYEAWAKEQAAAQIGGGR